MNPYQPEMYRTTYEYDPNPQNKKYSPLEETKNVLYETSHERLSSSPPIILCETSGSRNNKFHKHRYLFYPSASRLTPFSGNDNNINNIKNALKENEKNIINNKNETDLNNNEKSPEKYQTMYDKSFELVKRISELVPGEDIKIKGNSEYYLNKDQDYMNIIDKEINTLTNHFKNSNFNLGYNSDGNLIKNSNLLNSNNDNDKNLTYDQYKNSLLQKIKNNKNENFEKNLEENGEKPYNDINNINVSNRNYINDYMNSKDNKNFENVEINQPEIEKENNNSNNIYKNKKENIKLDENNNGEENNINNNIDNNTLKEKQDEQNNNNINTNKIPEKINQYNTLDILQNNENTNKINNENNKLNNYINPKEAKIPLTLIDENNFKILSSDNKTFEGELIDSHYQKGNQIFVRTKGGSEIKLNILRGKEGEPLCNNGFALMGKGNKFFYDKNGNIILYPDNEFIKGDKVINVRVVENNNKNNLKEFCVNKNNFGNEDGEYGIGEGTGNIGMGTGEFKKSKMKSKWYMFPKGDGSAKAPIIRKRKKNKK